MTIKIVDVTGSMQTNGVQLNPPQESADDRRIGALLVRMGLVSRRDVEIGLARAMEEKLPLGKMLLIQEKLTAPALRLSVDAQWMIKDGVLMEEAAFEAVRVARRNGWTLSDALIALGVEAFPEKGARLGQLLVKTEAITQEELIPELDLANKTGLPLGRVLVLRGKLGEGTIWHAVRLQTSIRKGELQLDQAIELLTRINEHLLCCSFKLGELFVAAKKLKRNEVEVALAIAQANNKQTGDVLLEMGWVDDELLDRAVHAQALLRRNRIDYAQAIEMIRDGACNGYENVGSKTADLAPPQSISLYEFLKLTGYFARTKLEDAVTRLAGDKQLMSTALKGKPIVNVRQSIKEILDDSSVITRVLEQLYPEDRWPLSCAKMSFALLSNGHMTAEEALIKYFAILRDSEERED